MGACCLPASLHEHLIPSLSPLTRSRPPPRAAIDARKSRLDAAAGQQQQSGAAGDDSMRGSASIPAAAEDDPSDAPAS